MLDKSELEDLYLPYKPKRRTKATIAREKGLGPLATYLWEQEPTAVPLETFAATFVDAEQASPPWKRRWKARATSWRKRSATMPTCASCCDALIFEEGVIVSKKTIDAADEQEKFKMYYDYREPVKTIPSHRMLAIRRGETRKRTLLPDRAGCAAPTEFSEGTIHKQPGDWTAQLNLATEDAWKRLLNSSITAEVRLELKQRSDADAIQVFRDNLHHLLLAPPAGQSLCWGWIPVFAPAARLPSLTTPASFWVTT